MNFPQKRLLASDHEYEAAELPSPGVEAQRGQGGVGSEGLHTRNPRNTRNKRNTRNARNTRKANTPG